MAGIIICQAYACQTKLVLAMGGVKLSYHKLI